MCCLEKICTIALPCVGFILSNKLSITIFLKVEFTLTKCNLNTSIENKI